jgi:hypothetical protein
VPMTNEWAAATADKGLVIGSEVYHRIFALLLSRKEWTCFS